MEVFLQYLAKGSYYHQIGRTEGIAMMLHLQSVATTTKPEIVLPTTSKLIENSVSNQSLRLRSKTLV